MQIIQLFVFLQPLNKPIGPFVYRLGHVPFTDERGVRFPYGLQRLKITTNNLKEISRDGAVVARRARNPKVAGSSPAPATIEIKSSEMMTFLLILT